MENIIIKDSTRVNCVKHVYLQRMGSDVYIGSVKNVPDCPFWVPSAMAHPAHVQLGYEWFVDNVSYLVQDQLYKEGLLC